MAIIDSERQNEIYLAYQLIAEQTHLRLFEICLLFS